MKRRTAQLKDLVLAIGVSLVVTPQKPYASSAADFSSENFTASIRQDGLSEAIDNDFLEY